MIMQNLVHVSLLMLEDSFTCLCVGKTIHITLRDVYSLVMLSMMMKREDEVTSGECITLSVMKQT